MEESIEKDGFRFKLIKRIDDVHNRLLPQILESVTSLQFSNNRILRIPDEIESIAPYAFLNLYDVEEIFINKNIINIGESVFWNCLNLRRIIFDRENKIEWLSENVINNCPKLEKVVFSANLKYLDWNLENLSLKDIDFPNSLTCIGGWVFAGNSNLTELIFPDNVLSIGDNAFRNNSSIKHIHFPKKLNVIGRDAFYLVAPEIIEIEDISLLRNSGMSVRNIKDKTLKLALMGIGLD